MVYFELVFVWFVCVDELLDFVVWVFECVGGG